MSTFSAPKGTFDVVPPRSAAWLAVKEALSAPPRASGYAFIETPVFEDTALFVRGVGESTDVVVQGDVHVRGPRRPLVDASTRRHGTGAASDRRTWPRPRATAGQSLVRRPQLPLRTATEWTLSSTHPGRCRDRGISRSGNRRRSHLAGLAGLFDAWAQSNWCCCSTPSVA